MAEIDHPAKREIMQPVLLNAGHDLSRFDCGNEVLNDWLKLRARDSEGRTARTYVACEDNVVVGYYCLAAGAIERGALPKALKKHGLPNPIPVAIIGRLARDVSCKGSSLGLDLLQHAFNRIVHAFETIGIRCVLVRAIDEQAAKFWSANEFAESPIGSRTFFLPLETIIDGLNE